MKIAVVVPLYRPTLTPEECAALRNNTSVLAARDIVILAPHGVEMEQAQRIAPAARVMRVGDEWLGPRNGIAGYNRMMRAAAFYDLFAAWDYILVCHTDAWIFRDELDDWAGRGFDCVAAPWVRRAVYDLPLVKHYMALRQWWRHRRGTPCRADLYGRVGNGGLSLRRVAAFRAACDRYAGPIAAYDAQRGHLYNEDVFWATVPREFRYPGWREALGFAFDTNPAYCYRITGRRLPMGCHSWSKPRMYRFWRQIIKPDNTYGQQE